MHGIIKTLSAVLRDHMSICTLEVTLIVPPVHTGHEENHSYRDFNVRDRQNILAELLDSSKRGIMVQKGNIVLKNL